MKKPHSFPSPEPQRYPLAIMAAYGPDNTLATKLVVSVLTGPDRRDPSAMEKWTSETTDVRKHPAVATEVSAFLRRHGVHDRVTPDRIIGCPHEEGIDYPLGRTCPQCPFWAGIDRFTHDPLTSPAPTMSVDEILTSLSRDLSASGETLSSADAHRSELIGPLLAVIDRVVAQREDAANEDVNLFSYAVYLLAKWREPRAYPGIIRWFSLPEEQPFIIGGDIVTQHGARILAAVCDGDLEPIRRLILNRNADEYGRSNGVSALALLAAWGEIPRESIVDYFLWLAREGLEREQGQVWNSLAWNAAGTLDVTPWMEWFLGCLGRAFDGTETTLAAVLRKARFWEDHSQIAINDRQRAILNRLLDGFTGNLTTTKWASLTKSSHDTALRDIQHLIERGILKKDAGGGRSTSYSLSET